MISEKRKGFRLKKGTYVKIIGPSGYSGIGKVGIIVGFGLKNMREGCECYWIRMKGWPDKGVRILYYIDFLKPVRKEEL